MALFASRMSFRTLYEYHTELKRMMYDTIYINISSKATINQGRNQRDHNSRSPGLANAFPRPAYK